MTKVTFYRKEGSDKLYGFKAYDHAGFGAYGNDIVCAALSALIINAVNSIEVLTKDKYDHRVSEEATVIELIVLKEPSGRCDTLIKSLLLGVKSIAETYEGYVDIDYLEV